MKFHKEMDNNNKENIHIYPLTLSKFLMSLNASSGLTRALTTGLSARATAFLALS